MKAYDLKIILNRKRFSVLLLVVLFLTGCTQKAEQEKKGPVSEDRSPVLAIVGERSISAKELENYLAGKSRRVGLSEEDLSAILGEMIREEVLYQQAKALQLHEDPEVLRKFRQILSQRLLEDQVNRKVWKQKVDENELKAAYEAQIARFNRPEQIRISMLYAAYPEKASDEQKTEARKKLESAKQELEKSKQRDAFNSLMRKASDVHPRIPGNSTGFFGKEGLPGLPDQVVKAAFAIERVGQTSNEIVDAEDGTYLILLTGKRAAVERSLESVRPELERQIRRNNLARVRKEFIEDLKQKADVKIDSAALSDFALTQKSPDASRKPNVPPRLPAVNKQANESKPNTD